MVSGAVPARGWTGAAQTQTEAPSQVNKSELPSPVLIEEFMAVKLKPNPWTVGRQYQNCRRMDLEF
jgi:hypothetical protein